MIAFAVAVLAIVVVLAPANSAREQPQPAEPTPPEQTPRGMDDPGIIRHDWQQIPDSTRVFVL
jgi:hypothetical protein